MPAEQPHSGYCPSCESTALVLLTDSKSAPILLKSVPDTGKPWWQNPEDGVPLLICFLFLFLVCLAALLPFPNEVSLFPFYPYLIPSPSEHKPSSSALLSLTCCCSKELLVSRFSLSAFLSLLSREKEVKTPWISSLLLTSAPVSFSQARKGFLGTRRSSRSLEQQPCTFWLILLAVSHFQKPHTGIPSLFLTFEFLLLILNKQCYNLGTKVSENHIFICYFQFRNVCFQSGGRHPLPDEQDVLVFSTGTLSTLYFKWHLLLPAGQVENWDVHSFLCIPSFFLPFI